MQNIQLVNIIIKRTFSPQPTAPIMKYHKNSPLSEVLVAFSVNTNFFESKKFTITPQINPTVVPMAVIISPTPRARQVRVNAR